ncbi:2-hydroxy-3-oxopropionate reductase [Pseudomonas agarici]|uniref:2-hydroxy-3-oxopropionate reductase n=1 Tax=Pseudomonas agarici TaxID=46677 RepID=A0A0X1T4T1_PSEAA|nr:NAD(P)-dependent oxidoreductase [Pseudomonas agarici]AMB87020.1 2-hydroxy-3-oxopropionate reductase [Pseudomonas agarici]NWB92166.1 NAD(P)-dependent oxidoreductase [Pseudomonas agarici]NWC09790.1 NAD(P)-dependent oxidoreductase [Pseudomonas agarici]SEL30076.1 3-hydroxyisobutyrate dehydrogenase [Pseudomonas agarici]
MTQSQRIGFIGLGMMGGPMTTCLSEAGYELFLADADAGRLTQTLSQLKATALDAGNARSLDVLITMLPNSAIVESVLLGSAGTQGWAASLRAGAVVIDMSSSEPARSRDLALKLKALELDYLDAPVSGGVKRAVEGTLAILVGGDGGVMARCQPVLAAMGKNILHIGTAGSGHAAKALNNYVSAAGLMATVEALHVAERFGINPDVMVDVLNASSGRSNTSENKARQFMLSGSFGSGFSMQLMNKDLKIAQGLADALGYPMRLGKTATALWDDVSKQATVTTDHTEMYRLLVDNDGE